MTGRKHEALRKALNDMGWSVGDDEAVLRALSELSSHSVRLVRISSDDLEYNCFEWALGLHDLEAYRRLSKDYYSLAGAGPEFEEFLIEHLVELQTCHGLPSRHVVPHLVLYFLDGVPYHAGRCTGSVVESKWGSTSIYRHAPLDVPEDYGSDLRCYRMPTLIEAWALFCDFTETQGFVDDFLAELKALEGYIH